MRQSQFFTKTLKQAPKDEVSKNAQLLIKAGYIYKEMAGVYAYLPLGLKVLNNIIQIIREEMDTLGGQEIILTALQRKEIWEKTNRWDDEELDVWFKTKLKNDSELGLGTTHEEPLTELMKQYISSYRDLPAYPYQFQTKFRNETRAKSGIMRTREFIMKDLYSFSRTQEEHDEFYNRSKQAYLNVYNRVGLGDYTYMTFASGGSFSKFSHEFQTLSEAGEDIIYVHEEKNIAINKEVYTPEVLVDLGVEESELVEKKAIEVGNIFSLGTKFSDALDLKFSNENGESQSVIMGSYGIGPGRLMGTVAEVFADDNGLVWPEEVAPYKVHLLGLDLDDATIKSQVDKVYEELIAKGIEVLYDDRENARPGEKFADSDLLGMPWRFVISKRTEGNVEIKKRTELDSKVVSLEEALASL